MEIPATFLDSIRAKRFDALTSDPSWSKYRDAVFPWVCAHTDETTVKFFLEQGANPVYKKDNPLYAACSYGRLEIVKILLTYESVRAHAAGRTNRSLISAQQDGYTEIVSALMEIPCVAAGPSMTNLY